MWRTTPAGAEMMRDAHVRIVLVTQGEQLREPATDRDLVNRSVASRHDPGSTTVVDACSAEMIMVGSGVGLVPLTVITVLVVPIVIGLVAMSAAP